MIYSIILNMENMLSRLTHTFPEKLGFGMNKIEFCAKLVLGVYLLQSLVTKHAA